MSEPVLLRTGTVHARSDAARFGSAIARRDLAMARWRLAAARGVGAVVCLFALSCSDRPSATNIDEDGAATAAPTARTNEDASGGSAGWTSESTSAADASATESGTGSRTAVESVANAESGAGGEVQAAPKVDPFRKAQEPVVGIGVSSCDELWRRSKCVTRLVSDPRLREDIERAFTESRAAWLDLEPTADEALAVEGVCRESLMQGEQGFEQLGC